LAKLYGDFVAEMPELQCSKTSSSIPTQEIIEEETLILLEVGPFNEIRFFCYRYVVTSFQ